MAILDPIAAPVKLTFILAAIFNIHSVTYCDDD